MFLKEENMLDQKLPLGKQKTLSCFIYLCNSAHKSHRVTNLGLESGKVTNIVPAEQNYVVAMYSTTRSNIFF